MEVPQFDSLSSTSSFLANLTSLNDNFSNYIESETKKSSARIIKLDNMKYRVEEGDQVFSQNSSDSEDNRGSISSEPLDTNSNIQEKPDAITPFLNFQIAPLDVQPFLTQLPHNLTSFIKEMVVIIKQYNAAVKSYDYQFQFQKLDLTVLFSKNENGLKIVVAVNDKDLQNDLTKERQDLMSSILQKRLDTDQIELEFEFASFDKKKDNEGENNPDNQNSDDQS